MTADPEITAILHACRWPDHGVAERRAAALEAISPGRVQVIEAREQAGAASGAAALVNRAAKGARAPVLLVVQPSVEWPVEALARTVEAARRERLVRAGREGPCRLWAIERALFDELGGLDARLWSIGEFDDLAARAALEGVRLAVIDVGGEWRGPEAYPLRREARALLEIRNPLVTAFRTQPAPALGETLAFGAAAALGASSRAAGLDPTIFHLGSGSPIPAASRLPDQIGTLVPILALDSFLAEAPALARERKALSEEGRREGGEERRREEGKEGRQGDNVDFLTQLQVGLGANTPESPARSGPLGASVPPWPSEKRDTSVSPRLGGNVETRAGVGRACRPAEPGAAPSLPSAVSDSALAPSAQRPAPSVSVIIVNWNGREHLVPCFQSLEATDYPADRLELILVDNGSTDGSRELMAARFPAVKVVALDTNLGFTGGNNAGVGAARGDVLAFFNNDMRVAPEAIRALVAAIDERHPAVAARVLDWAGRRIDFVRGTINFEARGFQEHFGEPDRPELTSALDTFFPNGAAFAVTRDAYARSGGFDDSLFAYYDDVDLGWRLRLAGFDIRVATDAVVYHRHSATSRKHPGAQKRFLMERNALQIAIRNYEEPTLHRVLGPILLLAARRMAEQTVVGRLTPVARALAPFSKRCRHPLGRNTTMGDVYEAAGRPEGLPHPNAERPSPSAYRLVRRMPLEALAAAGSVLANLPRLAAERRAVQAGRVVTDTDVLPWFGRPFYHAYGGAAYADIQDALVEVLDMPALFGGRSRLLIITHEPLVPNISGPGVRVLEIGRALSDDLQVTIATPSEPGIAAERCAIAAYSFDDVSGLRRLAEQADVLLVQGFTLARFPFLEQLGIPIAVDLYCPFTLEHLEMTRYRGTGAGGQGLTDVTTHRNQGREAGGPGLTDVTSHETRGTSRASGFGRQASRADTHARDESHDLEQVSKEAADILAVQNDQLRDGDFFICASERQRDFWIGALHTAGRINPLTYAADPTLRKLVDVVPFGLPEQELDWPGRPRALKGVRPGIRETDRVLLWAGSLLDWQDPQTLIRAVAQLSAERDDVKLFFMGIRHPNPQVKPMRIVEETIELARALGVLDTHVFFNDWVPYDQRGGYLVDADLGLSTHRDHLETRFSYRTRMLDYIWAGLPIVCTTGDHFAALVTERRLGVAVPPGDADALAGAIRLLLDDRARWAECREHLRALRDDLRWSRVVAPLRQFARSPAFAADRAPAMRAMRERLTRSFRFSRWLRRSAVAVGVSEGRIEQIKQWKPVRAAMAARNRVAVARARSRTRQG